MSEGLYDKIDQGFKATTNLTNEGLVQRKVDHNKVGRILEVEKGSLELTQAKEQELMALCKLNPIINVNNARSMDIIYCTTRVDNKKWPVKQTLHSYQVNNTPSLNCSSH